MKTKSKKQRDKSSSTSEHVFVRRTKNYTRKTKFGVTKNNQEDENLGNLFDNSHVVEQPEKANGTQLLDRELDSSLESGCPSTSSSPTKASAPYKKRKSPTGLCPLCQKLYQRAKRLKTPIKDKFLDNDPTSLTCDHWVLLKKWMPRRLTYPIGKLSHTLELLHTHLNRSKKAKQKKQHNRPKNLCSRLHIFLQRNLRQFRKVQVKKGGKRNRKKRARNDSQGPRVTRQKRHLGNSLPQNNSGHRSDQSRFHSTSEDMDVKGQNMDEGDKNATVNVHPSKSLLETSKLGYTAQKQRAPTKKTEFQELLAQVRGNRSTIFNETQ
ncbi:uncharacterized protein si:ch211-227n13.3 isoform X2 [Corythoichthys intestinalis]|uniref:uncharacterized protein si:ch211-227n13.3 isoform X2 n=1 Tax=Corythoichthys intestinalis TaxID=161448 RepID=UPI0025A50D4E|nr:uncharacterized protein si:ch211-227n13.3 isoform X2 [Corythoichthys intestinalis]